MNDQTVVEALTLFGMGFITGLSGAAIPGPLFAFVISDTLKKGFLSGPLTALGHVIVELPVIVAFMLGIGALLMGFQHFIYAVGGVVFIIMSLHIMRESLHYSPSNLKLHFSSARYADAKPSQQPSHRKIHQNISQNMQKYGKRNSVIGGLIFTAFNPSFIPWWMTAGFPILLMGLSSSLSHAGVIIVVMGHFTSDISWYSLVSLLIAMGRKHLIGRWYRTLMFIVSSFLAALGIFFLLSLIPFFSAHTPLTHNA